MLALKYFGLSLAVLFCCNASNAQAPTINVAGTAVPTLRVSPDARTGGMADAGIALPGADANAFLFNAARMLSAKEKNGIAINYTPWLREMAGDMYLLSLNAFTKISDNETIHGGIRYFSLGDMQFVDNDGNHLQSFRPREWSLTGGYARKITARSSIGLNLTFIYSGLSNGGVSGNDYKAGTAVAADLGYFFNGLNAQGSGWSFGANLSNLGSKVSYSTDAAQSYFLPANLGLGAAWSKAMGEQHKLTFALDINKLLVPTAPSDSAALVRYSKRSVVSSWFASFSDAPGGFAEELKEFQVSLGAEYWYQEQFALRAGYFYENPAKGDRQNFTLGAGVKYKQLSMNFSYLVPAGSGVNRSPLSNTLRFGIVAAL